MALLETLTDDFNAASLDLAKWAKDADVSCTAVQSGGQVTLTATGTGFIGITTFSLGHFFTYTNSYAFVQLISLSTPNSTNNPFSFALNNNTATDNLGWVIDAGFLQAFHSSTQIGSNVTYNSAVHRFLRIKDTAGTTSFDYSTDGVNWTSVGTVATPSSIGSAADAEIYTFGDGVSVGCVAVIDNFNIPPAATTTSTSTSLSTSSTSSSISTSTSSTSTSRSTSTSSTSTSTSSTSTSRSTSTSSTSTSISTSISTSSTSTSTTVSITTSTSSTSISTSTSSTSSSISTSTSKSTSTSSTSVSTSTTASFTTSTSSTSASSTSMSTSTTTTIITNDKPTSPGHRGNDSPGRVGCSWFTRWSPRSRMRRYR